MNNILNSKDANVYYYYNDQKLYDEIGNDLKMTEDGYYEFYIDHNSSYVITTEKLADSYIANKISDTANLNNSTALEAQKAAVSTNQILAIATFVFAVLAFIVAMISLKKKNNK